MQYRLWTRNFSITTIGSLISMMGNAVIRFALGRVVYDNTGSSFLYALFLLAATIPRAVVPLLIGPYLDKVSRRNTIINVDVFYTMLFVVLAVMAGLNYFSYATYILIALVIGVADSIYMVAYDSFYPELITPGNFSKAYSISSLLYPLANTVMVPVANFVYDSHGVTPLFVFCAFMFLITQAVERLIKVDEKHLNIIKTEKRSYAQDFKEGLNYLKHEKGLMAITGFFFITMMVGAIPETVLLPYFSSHLSLTPQMYSYLLSANTLGRIIGGVFHYYYHFKPERKFVIAVSVYTILSFTNGLMLFVPYPMMLLFMVINGMLAVTSFNIRTSGTQSHVPEQVRGRFNGLFAMVSMAGSLLGQLLGGVLGEVVPIPLILLVAQSINFVSALAIMLPNSKHVKLVYNQDI